MKLNMSVALPGQRESTTALQSRSVLTRNSEVPLKAVGFSMGTHLN